MPDRLSIGADVVEAAAKAAGETYWNAHNPPSVRIGNFKLWEEVAEAAILAALDKLGLRELYAALRVLAATDESLDTQEVEYDDLFDQKLIAQSRDIADEYTTYLTADGRAFVLDQLKRFWRQVDAEPPYETGLGQADVVDPSVRVDTEPSEPEDWQVEAMVRVIWGDPDKWAFNLRDKRFGKARDALIASRSPSATSEGEPEPRVACRGGIQGDDVSQPDMRQL